VRKTNGHIANETLLLSALACADIPWIETIDCQAEPRPGTATDR